MKFLPVFLGFAMTLPSFLSTANAKKEEENLPEVSTPEIRVDPQNPGENAFATIQEAVDAAKPGDTVEIASGIYKESVVIKNSGTPGRPITIRPAPNAIVILNLGTKLEGDFQPVSEHPEVYVAKISPDLINEKVGIWETPSRLRLAAVNSVFEVANRLASWYFDAKTSQLYIRSSGVAPANKLTFWFEASDLPGIEVKASYIQIQDLEITLGQHGILIPAKQSHVEVTGVRAYCNSQGGIHLSGDHHRILYNECFQNNGYGIQMRYGVNHVYVAENLCYLNGPNNGQSSGTSVPTDLGIYSLGDYNLVEKNIIDGIHQYAYRYKTGHGTSRNNVLRNNVIRGHLKAGPYGVYDNTLIVNGLGMRGGMYMNGGDPSPIRSWENVDPLGQQRVANLITPLVHKEDPHFADPSYRDFRLQSTSPYSGRGAYPAHHQVFYVDPEKGSDEATGTSIPDAFATLEQAFQMVTAGATIYLLPGTYTEEVIVNVGGFDPQHPLRIRAYQHSPNVHITAAWSVQNVENVEIDGLTFSGPGILTERAHGLVVRNTLFTDPESSIALTNTNRATIRHCTFLSSNNAIQLTTSFHNKIVESVFSKTKSVLLSDTESLEHVFLAYNAYDTFRIQAGETTYSDFSVWQKEHQQDPFSILTSIKLDEGGVTPPDSALASMGIDFGSIGARTEAMASQLAITDLRVAGLSPNTVSLLWNSPRQTSFSEIILQSESGETLRQWEPAMILQIMGQSFDMTRYLSGFFASTRHAVVDNLKPGTSYKAIVTSKDQSGARSNPVEISFTTPTTLAPAKTFFVSPEGKDQNSGTSADAPWNRITYALEQVSPGDEIILLPGRYSETIRPRISGTKDAPITIRSQTPGEAILDMALGIEIGAEIINTHYITLDGLRIAGGSFPRSQAYILSHTQGIVIRNGFMDYPEGSTFEKLKLGYSGIVANRSPELLVENNQFLCAVVGVAASHSTGTIVRHNTFIGEGNYGVVIIPGSEEETYTIDSNLFYRAVMGYKTGPCIWVFEPMPKLHSDYNVFYIPEEHKGTIGKLPDTDRLFPLTSWQETGLDAHSHQLTPEFIDPINANFQLKPNSPGTNLARDKKSPGQIFP